MDLNAIRSKLNSLQQQNKGNGGSNQSLFWKPSIGKQVVRIVPNKFNKANRHKMIPIPVCTIDEK